VLRCLVDRFDLVGAYDVRGDRLPRESLPPLLASEADVIAASEVVIVSTPTEVHASCVAGALAAGRHVLVEKPLCATSREASALAAAARPDARLFVGHSERFNPVVRALMRMLRGEELVVIDLRRVGLSTAGGVGALLNLGVHDFDLAAYLGGAEARLQSVFGGLVAAGSTGGRGRPVDDFAHVRLVAGRAAIVHVHVDRTIPTKERRLRVSTRRWVYEGDLLAHRLVRTARHASVGLDVPLPIEEPLLAQASALADALDGAGGLELATGADGARAVHIAEQAYAILAAAERARALGASRAPL